jgi:hypothetical protein
MLDACPWSTSSKTSIEKVVSWSEDADPNKRRLRALEALEETEWDNMKDRIGIVADEGRAELQ